MRGIKEQSYFDQLQDILVEPFDTNHYQYQIKMHYHNGLELIYFDAANGYMLVGGTRYRAEAGTALMINSYQLHTPIDILPNTRYSRILITVDDATAKNCLEQLRLGDLWNRISPLPAISISRQKDRHGELRFRFHSLLRQKGKKDSFSKQRTYGELALLLGDFALLSSMDTAPTELGEPPGIRGILSYLDRHYREPISLEKLEHHFFLSRNHICRTFKQATGLTISQYVNRKRMIDAQRMLRGSDLAISEICFAAGFGDIAYFTKLFHKMIGCTPGEYRKTGGASERGVATF